MNEEGSNVNMKESQANRIQEEENSTKDEAHYEDEGKRENLYVQDDRHVDEEDEN